MASMKDHTTSQDPEDLTARDATGVIRANEQEQTSISHETTLKDWYKFLVSQTPTRLPQPDLPPITIATNNSTPSIQAHYITQSATISAHANLADPLNLQFETEKPDNTLAPSKPVLPGELLALYVPTNKARLQVKINSGSVLVEAGDFAATACWTPPTHSAPRLTKSEIDAIATSGRPIFADFLSKVEAAKERNLYPISERYWHLSLMARDPRREYVPGAVRAVLQPFLRAAERDNVPVWLEAGNVRARDVYAHFGLAVCEVVIAGGCETWCMIRR